MTSSGGFAYNRILRFAEPVDFRGQDEVALRQAVNLVRPDRDFDLSPSQVYVGVVTLFFSKSANLIHKCEGLSEVWKLEELRNVVFLNNLPPIHLPV